MDYETRLPDLPRATFLLRLIASVFLLTPFLSANSAYYRHVIFDNSAQQSHYFYSTAQASAPSTLEQEDGRLPVESKIFLTPPNAIRLEWQSRAGGGWDAEIHIVNFRNRYPEVNGRNLYFWCFAPQAIAATNLPQIVLSDARDGLQVAQFPGSFTAPEPLGKFTGDLPPGRWVQVRIPMAELHSASIYAFRPEHLQTVVFHQGRSDGAKHVLIVDEIRVGDDPVGDVSAPLAAPEHVHATGYDRHVVVRWDTAENPAVARYVIYRSLDGGSFEPIGTQLADIHRYSDFIGRSGAKAEYKIAASDWQYRQSPLSSVASAATRELNDDELLTMLQEAAFQYYWEGGDTHSGMAHENLPGDDRIVATGASGFGICALVVGTDRHFITREQGLARLDSCRI